MFSTRVFRGLPLLLRVSPAVRQLNAQPTASIVTHHIRNVASSDGVQVSWSLEKARPVVLLGSPVLREVCRPCGSEPLVGEKEALVSTLEAFRKANGFGRGIAAPQIGIPRRFIAVNMGSGPRVLTDPTITWASDETFSLFDDCMSLPWILCKVRRHVSISVEFSNEDGKLESWEQCDQALSELLQHEIDHLDGKLIVDIAEGGGHGIVSRQEFESDPARFRPDVDYFIEPTIV
eukprot:INCI19084.1.p1 GENE.INCI19084.1~~INCI19084.1.p1  ORF type:complete len:234 (+),score=25.04 INCI19084.1:119-820(+)